jgi:diguanylate cyclase (GGDEF)-like protein
LHETVTGRGDVRDRTSAGVVLIAGDQETTRRPLERVLESHGYEVIEAYTRRQALEELRRKAPDVMVIDPLPDANAYEFCRELRALRLVTPSTPILLTLPTPPTRRDRLAARLAGAWDCFGSPLDAEELLATLGTFLPAKFDADKAGIQGLVDDATGLYNARGLTRCARELGAHAARRRAALACVLLAPDTPADRNGPSEGEMDALLRQMVPSLKSVARGTDVLGRLGPDALAVVAADTDARQARLLAERLAEAIVKAPRPANKAGGAGAPYRLRGGYAGVADFRAAGIDTAELVRRATVALQKVRERGSGDWLRSSDEGDDATPD